MRGQMIDLFGAMVRKNLLVMLRYPITFVSGFLSLLLLILVVLFTTRAFLPDDVQNMIVGRIGSSQVGVTLYGFILFLFVTDALWTIGYNVRVEQYEGTLEALYLTPASRWLYLVSRLMNPLVWTGLNSIALLLCARALLGPLPAENLGLALYTLGCTLAGIFGLGFVMAAATLLIKEAAQLMTNLLQFGLLTVCAIVVPFAALPPTVRAIGRMVPLSYGVDLFRSALLGFPPGFPELARPEVEVLIVTLWALLMPPLGYLAYRRVERHVQTTGSLASF